MKRLLWLGFAAALASGALDVRFGTGKSTIEGFGQERPAGDNRTEEGRARNRRVELVKR